MNIEQFLERAFEILPCEDEERKTLVSKRIEGLCASFLNDLIIDKEGEVSKLNIKISEAYRLYDETMKPIEAEIEKAKKVLVFEYDNHKLEYLKKSEALDISLKKKEERVNQSVKKLAEIESEYKKIKDECVPIYDMIKSAILEIEQDIVKGVEGVNIDALRLCRQRMIKIKEEIQ